MALPFFGKKPSSGSGDAGERGAAAAPGGDRKPPPTELSTLDFTGGDASHALARCAGQVEVQELDAGGGAAYEEAAVLYANGNVADAEKVLVAVLEDPAGSASEGLWMMLLDLYKLTGQRQSFESHVLDYATRFERSPPPWEDLSSPRARARGDATPLINLSGNLNGQAAPQFQQISVIGRKGGAIRIDLTRLRSVDDEGCRLFLELLRQLAAERVKVSVLKGSQLANMLAGQIAPGRAENREAWLLMLEMLQYTGEQERFEEVAVDYAITFEESPPSWMGKSEAGLTATSVETVTDKLDTGFSLEGEIIGTQTEGIRKLAAYAAELQNVDVDCAQLRRMDFVSAGTLFNILATLQAQGKLVVLHKVNAMVAALLRVMGVDQVAQVMLRS
ncbi:STAS domain-containing protein [Pseudothauera rhizosphaerae]|uniref:STAS domain-containing protein n=1 Tax=Pseudothauera rhizosphaerae TaxID=2565932 RepID=A0A4V3WAH9_9RHOO|nr:STAS domain-containing protein [Pseudothauera rhizosphaerae]THF59342.1 STAS domain-containing protein [Pseudothauera rhizosphaerae]